MALDKKLMIPGVKLQVQTLKSKTAGIAFGNDDPLPALRIWSLPGIDLAFAANVGEILEVVKKPRQLGASGNCCRVRSTDGVEGEIWWTELRSNCKMVDS
jgi:hypothetical protein